MLKKHLTLLLLLCVANALHAANYLTFTAEEDNSSFGILSEAMNNPQIQYSLDNGSTWEELPNHTLILLNRKGDKALLRGYNPDGFSKDWQRHTIFVMQRGAIAASGSVMSLIDGEGESQKIPAPFCFYRLFYACESLIQAPELPATKLDKNCYDEMFGMCTSLKKAPVLPATQMAENCYARMFRGCSSLVQILDLPYAILAAGCYEGMFWDCTSLKKAPELNCPFLYENCYARMFRGCTNLTEAPDLPALHVSEHCYDEMFRDCPKISKITVNISAWGIPVSIRLIYEEGEKDEEYLSRSTQGWLQGVASTGTFICPEELPIEFGEDAIPVGWKVVKTKQRTYDDIYQD